VCQARFSRVAANQDDNNDEPSQGDSDSNYFCDNREANYQSWPKDHNPRQPPIPQPTEIRHSIQSDNEHGRPTPSLNSEVDHAPAPRCGRLVAGLRQKHTPQRGRISQSASRLAMTFCLQCHIRRLLQRIGRSQIRSKIGLFLIGWIFKPHTFSNSRRTATNGNIDSIGDRSGHGNRNNNPSPILALLFKRQINLRDSQRQLSTDAYSDGVR
jgi:hypothetical protein